jgi:long-chain acyl-CoA synthetase
VDADGWLHSGDIGALDADGFVTVVDRKKDIIITAGGKNITPSNIENALKRQPLISQAMVVGDRRAYLTALLTLDEPAARLWAKRSDVEAQDWAALIADPRLQAELQQQVDAANADFSRVEQVKRFTVLPDEWSPATDELTPTLKVKRKVVGDKYAAAIEAMYRVGT